MKTKNLLLIAATVQFFPLLAHAQAAQTTKESSTFTDLLWGFIPLLFLFIVFLVVLFLIVRAITAMEIRRGPRRNPLWE